MDSYSLCMEVDSVPLQRAAAQANTNALHPASGLFPTSSIRPKPNVSIKAPSRSHTVDLDDIVSTPHSFFSCLHSTSHDKDSPHRTRDAHNHIVRL
jgi:hypothetical protein